MWSIGRSVVAIVAGFAVVLLIFVGIGELVFEHTLIGQVPLGSSRLYTPAFLSVALARLVVSVGLGGFVAAWLARRATVWLGVAVGICMLFAALLDRVPDASIQPVWYSLISLAVIIPASAIGAATIVRRQKT